jgi:hypothetical protein
MRTLVSTHFDFGFGFCPAGNSNSLKQKWLKINQNISNRILKKGGKFKNIQNKLF